MASAWGESWGGSWGGSWGRIVEQVENKRSGVVRMWLAELTAKMNGMLDEKPEEPKPEPKPVSKLEKLIENADGSVTVGKEKRKPRVKAARKTSVQVAEEPVNNPPPPGHYKKYEQRNLPTPEQTAVFLITQLNIDLTNQVWAEEKIVELLKQVAEEAEEEELIIETAAMLLL